MPSDVRSYFAGIGASPGDSPVAAIFHEWQANRISQDQYLNLTAASVADTLNGFHPRAYLALTGQLIDYVERRISGSQEYNEADGKRLGLWIHGIIQAIEKNTADLEMLMWAAERCRSVNLIGAVMRIEGRAAIYKRTDPPGQVFERAIAVQQKDARERKT